MNAIIFGQIFVFVGLKAGSKAARHCVRSASCLSADKGNEYYSFRLSFMDVSNQTALLLGIMFSVNV